jgi:hypothetical protein
LSIVYTRWLPLALITGVIGYYFWYLLKYALNIPYQDEIYDVLGFLNELARPGDWLTSLQLFFIKWNEHSTASARLVYYLSYQLFGEINFVTLTVLANLALPAFVGLLYLRLHGQAYRWLVLLPVILTLFHFRAYYTALWSMTAFAYFCVLVYGFCCLYCLHKLSWARLVLACVFASLATFSLASGQLIWLVGLIGVAYQRYVLKTIPARYLAAWLLAATAALVVWYSPSWGHPDLHFENLRNLTAEEARMHAANVASIKEKPLLAALFIQLKFFLAMLGGVISDSSVLLATMTGIAFLMAFLFFAASAWRGPDIRLELCCVYIFLTVAAMAHGRAELVVLAEALNSRFSVPSAMLVCILWTLLAIRLQIRSVAALYLVALLAAVNNVFAYATYSDPIISHHDRLANQYNKQVFWLLGVPVEETARVVATATELGIYAGPPRPVPLADPSGQKKLVNTRAGWAEP